MSPIGPIFACLTLAASLVGRVATATVPQQNDTLQPPGVGVVTWVLALVGRPGEPPSSDPAIDVVARLSSVSDEIRVAENPAEVVRKLTGTFRLADIEETASARLPLKTGDRETIGSVAGVQLTLALVSFDTVKATYDCIVEVPGKPSKRISLTIMLGERAIIGNQDGAEAPYLFFVIKADHPFDKSSPEVKRATMRPPVIVKKVKPVYPEEARKAKIIGRVIIEATIDAQGDVAAARILESPDDRLSKAALEAVRQW
jgi:hypothetical protein